LCWRRPLLAFGQISGIGLGVQEQSLLLRAYCSLSDRWCAWASPNGFEASPSIDGGHFVATEEETEADRQATIDGSASKLGITLAIVGGLPD
jgi:hypothetical protein